MTVSYCLPRDFGLKYAVELLDKRWCNLGNSMTAIRNPRDLYLRDIDPTLPKSTGYAFAEQVYGALAGYSDPLSIEEGFSLYKRLCSGDMYETDWFKLSQAIMRIREEDFWWQMTPDPKGTPLFPPQEELTDDWISPDEALPRVSGWYACKMAYTVNGRFNTERVKFKNYPTPRFCSNHGEVVYWSLSSAEFRTYQYHYDVIKLRAAKKKIPTCN